MDYPEYTCPCCGFITLYEPFGYDICNVCRWEDDPLQHQYPGMDLGPNEGSLCEEQSKILKKLPINKKFYNGYSRDKEWRPLNSNECILPSEPHQDGLDYFNLIGDEENVYYWKKDK